ncbi:hypothetical protein ABVV53_09115 [Novosphingobium sp. RD2P27]|uniref:UrcA family protein n=1 Tax=Novosphingobium kalidii TaxID=3230299 RepID=A0ABV2D185_9SPHN
MNKIGRRITRSAAFFFDEHKNLIPATCTDIFLGIDDAHERGTLMLSIFAAILLAASAQAAGLNTKAAAQPVSEQTKEAAQAEEKVCRRIRETGSHISRRKVCMTKAEWDDVARQSQQLTRDMQPAWTTPNGG